MSTEYYSLEDVMRLLHKSKSTVLRDANAGLIPWELEEGKQKGRRYPKPAIDALVEVEKAKQKHKQIPPLVFSPSTPNDLWAEVNIGRELYGDDDIVPFKRLLEWRDINDEMFMSLKENNKVVAYTSFMPLEESVIHALIKDEIRERDIPLGTIKQWTDPHLSVYAASATVKPSGDLQKDRERGWILLRHALKWALTLHHQHHIKNWYAIGATKQGQKLLEGLGFTEMASLYGGERKGYILRDIEQPAHVLNQLAAQMNSEALEIP